MEEHKTYQTIEPAAFKRAEAAPNDRLISINPLKLTIAAAFLILALAALFMFNARAVLINFSPGVDDVAVSGVEQTSLCLGMQITCIYMIVLHPS